jgi:hypothetical protein
MMQLLASSGTIEGIEQMVRKFWLSDAYTVNRETLRIEHPTKDMNSKVRIVRKGRRYRFETL